MATQTDTASNYVAGRRVEFIREVERFPSFIVPVGATGVISEVVTYPGSPYFEVWVKVDQHIEGCEEWDNEVQFNTGDDCTDDLDSLKQLDA